MKLLHFDPNNQTSACKWPDAVPETTSIDDNDGSLEILENQKYIFLPLEHLELPLHRLHCSDCSCTWNRIVTHKLNFLSTQVGGLQSLTLKLLRTMQSRGVPTGPGRPSKTQLYSSGSDTPCGCSRHLSQLWHGILDTPAGKKES